MIETCQQPAVDHCEHATVEFDHALTCLPVYIGNLLHVRVLLEGVRRATRGDAGCVRIRDRVDPPVS